MALEELDMDGAQSRDSTTPAVKGLLEQVSYYPTNIDDLLENSN